jgi:FtsZ-binding cell division protein ZapB
MPCLETAAMMRLAISSLKEKKQRERHRERERERERGREREREREREKTAADRINQTQQRMRAG